MSSACALSLPIQAPLAVGGATAADGGADQPPSKAEPAAKSCKNESSAFHGLSTVTMYVFSALH